MVSYSNLHSVSPYTLQSTELDGENRVFFCPPRVVQIGRKRPSTNRNAEAATVHTNPTPVCWVQAVKRRGVRFGPGERDSAKYNPSCRADGPG